MLDDDEFALVYRRWEEGKHFINSPEAGQLDQDNVPVANNLPLITEAFKAMLDEYERITGYRETNPNAIGHHRLSLYGPPCQTCGKPLRSPTALFCAACGATREAAV